MFGAMYHPVRVRRLTAIGRLAFRIDLPAP